LLKIVLLLLLFLTQIFFRNNFQILLKKMLENLKVC